VLRQYETDIVGYFEDFLKKEDATTIIYNFAREEPENLSQIRDAFI